jgi:hypothetical protein
MARVNSPWMHGYCAIAHALFSMLSKHTMMQGPSHILVVLGKICNMSGMMVGDDQRVAEVMGCQKSVQFMQETLQTQVPVKKCVRGNTGYTVGLDSNTAPR